MPARKPEMRVVADAEALARAAAEEFLRLSRVAVKAQGTFLVALSGGETPRRLYSLLAEDAFFRAGVPWEKAHFFWGDERHVPPEDPGSNFRLVKEALLSKVPVPPANVHRIRSEIPDARRAAEEYEEELLAFFGLTPGEIPRFDLILLGMGADGHTASLFPDTPGLRENKRLVVANWVERLNNFRITMTLPLLNHAAMVLFLVSGGEKAGTLGEVFQPRGESRPYPAQRIQLQDGRCLWIVDRAAALYLNKI